MVKNILILISLTTISFSTSNLEVNCLKCHKEEKIPSELIYRRYLLKYSSKKIIKDKILEYLQNPKEDNSIMPKQFFLKFPIKKTLDINNSHIIDKYLEFFSIKNRLKLEYK